MAKPLQASIAGDKDQWDKSDVTRFFREKTRITSVKKIREGGTQLIIPCQYPVHLSCGN